MAETGKRQDPFVAFRFEVRFDEEAAYGGFSECTGLNLETQLQEYLEGGQNEFVHKLPTRTVQSNVVLKRGIVDTKLWNWYFELTRGNVIKRNVTILVHDPSGSEVNMEFRLREALPCKWTGPDLNASQSSVAVETFELCHQGLERRT
ncbi:MAG: phage tail protein [Gemmataceae bacterium]